MQVPARSILITGASAGLGAALALAYAAPGVRLGLVARSQERLDAVASACRKAGAVADTIVADVTDRKLLERALESWLADGAPDLAIVNAGVFDGNGPDRQLESMAEMDWQVSTNLLGLMATVSAILPAMRKRNSGTIALVGSLAALQPLPDAPAYSASKAGAMAYGESLRELLMPENIKVSLIYPGHIATQQVAHHVGPLPNLMQPEYAAATIKSRLDRGHTSIAFPWQLHWLIRVGRLVPWQVRAFFGKSFRFHVAK